MLTIDGLMSVDKDDLLEMSKTVEKEDLPQIVEWLSLKDDKVRYRVLLLLQSISSCSDSVYPFWDIFESKLGSDNSYQRSIGLMLIADNAKWDKDNRLDSTIDMYLMHLYDEKPITVRQCIQGLCKIVPYKTHLHQRIANKLISLKIEDIKETMRKSTLLDILGVLVLIRKLKSSDKIEGYIFSALSGELLDKKSKKQIESML